MKLISVTLRALLLMMIFYLITVSATFSEENTHNELQDRINELESENRRLRRTVEEQMELIMQLRNETKQDNKLPKRTMEQGAKKEKKIYSDNRWHGSIGIINFGIMDSGDHLVNAYSGGYDTSGNLYGGRFSLMKGRNGIGGSVYLGEYEFSSGADTDDRQMEQTSERLDMDLAWMHVIERDQRFQFGSLLGVKRLVSDKELTKREYDVEETFTGEAEWNMGTIGIFTSYRLMQNHPLFATGSFNLLIGQVAGTTPDQEDNTADGIINNAYTEESMSAYGFNGTLGLQYILWKHVALGAGYRGQILNSTDGFMDQNASFYDGHQSVYASLDIAF